MNRIESTFKRLKRQNHKALITYITAGDPDLSITEKLIYNFSRIGVDIIELGIPFSDPIADGPTIQAASTRALKHHTNIIQVINLVRKIRKNVNTPIIFMTYYNIFNNLGFEKFAKLAKEAGVDGVIIPDLPCDEGDTIIKPFRKAGIDIVFLAAPTSSNQRIKLIGLKSKGFVYYVSIAGVTGQRINLPEELKTRVNNIKKITKKPVCVGFGVSTPKQVKEISSFADGVIIGSAIVKAIERNIGKKTLVNNVTAFVATLKKACK